MKKSVLTFAFLFIVVGGFTTTFGQSVTLEPVGTAVDDTLLAPGQDHELAIRYTNPAGWPNYNPNNGWRIFSDDGAEWSYPVRDTFIEVIIPGVIENTTIDSFVVTLPNFRLLFNVTYQQVYFSPDGMGGDTLGFAGAADNTILGLMPGTDDSAISITIRTRAQDEGLHICIDSSWFPPGGTWKWASIDVLWMPVEQRQITPGWSGQQCFKLGLGNDVAQLENNDLPTSFGLKQNYPNPFNPDTKLEFDVPHRSHVTITVFNVLGQQITTLVDEQMTAGSYVADWDGRASSGNQVASGIYFYKMEADGFVETKKMMLLK
jgi:hypothetical protein